jgi:predicted kinase
MKIIILSGIPGSGKSTLIKLLKTENHTVISIDQFYERLRENNGMEWGRKIEIEAYRLFKEELEKLLEKEKDIIIETTGASDKWIDVFYSLRKRKDVQVIDILLEISLIEAKERIRIRNASSHPFKVKLESLEGWIRRINEVRNDYGHTIEVSDLSKEEVYLEVMKIITNSMK